MSVCTSSNGAFRLDSGLDGKEVRVCFPAKQLVHLSRYTSFTSGMRLSSASLRIPFWLMWHNLLCHNSPAVSDATFTSSWHILACIKYSVLIFQARATIKLPLMNFMTPFRMLHHLVNRLISGSDVPPERVKHLSATTCTRLTFYSACTFIPDLHKTVVISSVQ